MLFYHKRKRLCIYCIYTSDKMTNAIKQFTESYPLVLLIPIRNIVSILCKCNCYCTNKSRAMNACAALTQNVRYKRCFITYNHLNPVMHKVAKMITKNIGVRRHTGLTHGFWPTVLSVEPLVQFLPYGRPNLALAGILVNFDVRAMWRSGLSARSP